MHVLLSCPPGLLSPSQTPRLALATPTSWCPCQPCLWKLPASGRCGRGLRCLPSPCRHSVCSARRQPVQTFFRQRQLGDFEDLAAVVAAGLARLQSLQEVLFCRKVLSVDSNNGHAGHYRRSGGDQDNPFEPQQLHNRWTLASHKLSAACGYEARESAVSQLGLFPKACFRRKQCYRDCFKSSRRRSKVKAR